jgi:hypothetical protein
MDSQVVATITQLQNREKELHNSFDTLETPELKRVSLENMRKLTETRVELLNSLKSRYAKDVALSSSELEEELATLHIVENELDYAKKRLANLNQDYTNKMRMVEITTYFSQKYRAYNKLFKLVLMWLIPLGVLLYIGNRNPVPERFLSKSNSNTIFLLLILAVLFVGLYKTFVMLYDLKSRSNMNFNEYDFSGMMDMDKDVNVHHHSPTDGAIAHDVKEFEQMAKSLNLGCVDNFCCADGTLYDSVKKQCIPVVKTHMVNTQNASLTKGVMGKVMEQVKGMAPENVESFSKLHVPFSSV